MKAFIVDRYGKKSVRLGQMPEPTLRDDDVLVQVHAAGVNPLDSKIRDGEFKLFLLDLQHHELGVVVGGALEGTRDVFGRGRADGTVDAQHEHRRRLGAHVRGHAEQHEQAQPPDAAHRRRLTRRLTMRAHGDEERCGRAIR